jgi:hypothetical protein
MLLKILTKKLHLASGERSACNSVNSSIANITDSTTNVSLSDAGYLCFDNCDSGTYPAFELFLEDSFPYDILTVHPMEFARQATLMESELYKSIDPSELISLGKLSPGK